MKNYFVLLELPEAIDKRIDMNTSSNFWKCTHDIVLIGGVKIISSRADTGICEELKDYLKGIDHYTTFILLQAALHQPDLKDDSSLFSILASTIRTDGITEVIDYDNSFRVLAQA